MSIVSRDLPVHAPINRRDTGFDSAFLKRTLGRWEAQRLAGLMADAEKRALARLDVAKREATEIFAEAKAEAEAILAKLPDFAAIENAPATKGKSAFRAMREVADRHGLPLAVVVGRVKHDRATAARAEAVRAVADACPKMGDQDIASLFSGISAATVRRLRLGGAL